MPEIPTRTANYRYLYMFLLCYLRSEIQKIVAVLVIILKVFKEKLRKKVLGTFLMENKSYPNHLCKMNFP